MKFPDQYRAFNDHEKYGTKPGDPFGAFLIPPSKALGRTLRIIACDAEQGWEHVSVSLMDWPKKIPTWPEMCLVKDMFWDENAVVVQYHPAKNDYVNVHYGVLHLWRCTDRPFPMPPKEFV